MSSEKMASTETPTENTPELSDASIPVDSTSNMPVVAKKIPAPPTCKVILAQTIARPLLEEVTAGLQQLGRKPLLVGFLANDDPAAKAYADYSAKTCRENGFEFQLRTVEKEDIEDAILNANSDSDVDGIIVYYPIFPGSHRDQYVQQLVSHEKDVEGLCAIYVQNLYHNLRYLDSAQTLKSILPCTPLAIVKVLEHLQIYNTIIPYGNRLHGKTITVINRSEVVGRPLAALLANDGAKVYSVDLDGVQLFSRGRGLRKVRHEVTSQPNKTLEECLYLSDVVISGVPGKSYKIDTNLLRDGAVCINFSSQKNFDSDTVKQHASIYVPAIGKVTIAVLLRNLLRLINNREERLNQLLGPPLPGPPVDIHISVADTRRRQAPPPPITNGGMMLVTPLMARPAPAPNAANGGGQN